ncbi:MAG: hypothetical protein RL607_796 [Bacteroidota bacterium]|jgi:hypothetical protein
MNRLLLLVLFLSCGAVWSQSATEAVATRAEQSLKQVFAAPVLQAYQENSTIKMQELFFYLQQLTQGSLEPSLRTELETACLALFVHEKTLVVDVTAPTPTLIPIDQLLQKLALTAPLQITLSETVKYNTVTLNSWKNGFTIQCFQNESTRKYALSQTIYFQLQPQQFGSHQQYTYQYRLGDMELR